MVTKRRRKNITPKLRASVYNRDKLRCFYCGEQVFKTSDPSRWRGAVIDHLIPFNKGGVDEFWNYVTACMLCNAQKRDHTLEQFRKIRKESLLRLIEYHLKDRYAGRY